MAPSGEAFPSGFRITANCCRLTVYFIAAICRTHLAAVLGRSYGALWQSSGGYESTRPRPTHRRCCWLCPLSGRLMEQRPTGTASWLPTHNQISRAACHRWKSKWVILHKLPIFCIPVVTVKKQKKNKASFKASFLLSCN